MRIASIALLLANAAWLCGCAPKSPTGRTEIAGVLEERTGAGTRGGAAEVAWSTPSGVVLDDGLTRQEAVAVALWNNGPLQAALSGLGFARADLVQAGVLPNPVFSLMFPLGPKQFEGTVTWDVSFLWQRGRRVEVAAQRMQVLAEQLVANGLDVARDARVAHAECLRARARQAQALEAAGIWSQIAHVTEVLLQVGMASELDLNNVRTDVRAAEIQAGREARGADLALASLAQVLGMPFDAKLPEPVAAPPPTSRPELAALHTTALAARPELRAAELRIEAAAEQLGVEKAQVYQLTAILDANGEGTQGFEMGPGARFALPIFDFNQGGKARARAEIEQAAWNYLASVQRVTGEVRTAHAALVQAQEALARWPTEVVEPMEQNMRGAERAFEAGVTSYLNVLDVARRLIAARTQQLDLEADVRRASAQLARSVGRDYDAEH